MLDPVSFTGYQQAIRDLPDDSDDSAGPGRPGRPGHSGRRRFPPDVALGRPAPGEERPRRRRRNLVLTGVKVLLVGLLILVGVSIGRTLALPGDQGVLSRLAEWGRDHHLSFLVDPLSDS